MNVGMLNIRIDTLSGSGITVQSTTAVVRKIPGSITPEIVYLRRKTSSVGAILVMDAPILLNCLRGFF